MDIRNESYYDDLLSGLDDILQAQETEVISIICERIRRVGNMNPTSVKQLARSAQYANADLKQIRNAITRGTKMTREEINSIFRQAAEDSAEYADILANTAGRTLFSGNVEALAMAAAKRYEDAFNLSATTSLDLFPYTFVTDGQVLTVRQQYVKAVNRAITAVNTGTFDYSSIIRKTVSDMTKSGLRVREDTGERIITFASGHTRRLDSTVRMNVIEGVRQLNQEILKDTLDYADGFEISAHALPAPDHADIQGRQYRKRDYEILNASLERPIGTLNCMHIAYPIIYGKSIPTYTEAQLREMKSNAEKVHEWRGKKMTGYECTQYQRKLETAMRREQERSQMLRVAGDEMGAKESKRRERKIRKEYNEFSKAMGLRTKPNRTTAVIKTA